MSAAEDIPEPDCREGAPHPRETRALYGQTEAEAEILATLGTGRMHHAWLITGPEGIGKATLAWRMARYLIAHGPDQASAAGDGLFGEALAPEPPQSLDLDPDHPVSHRIAALSEPGLFLLRRPWDPDRKRLRQEITVDAARALHGFFGLSAADGGHRVVIVDAGDELNPNAANALLKLIEEPPPRCTLLIICHRPAAMLPTIRSRCRQLRCAPLDTEAMTRALIQAGATPPDDPAQQARLARLSGGSPGLAWDLLMLDGLALDQQITSLLSRLPGHDRRAALALAERLAPAAKAPERKLFYRLISQELADLARAGAGAAPPDDPDRNWHSKLAPNAQAARLWAEAQQSLGDRIAHAEAVNLDPQNTILDMMLKIEEVAARAQHAQRGSL
ncbi:MAG: DNA polymerase III subunit delta' [Mangrovicoccus sp.]|nr:DNA polymerase III subunit delta' [Mangrovicoccus sp.]